VLLLAKLQSIKLIKLKMSVDTEIDLDAKIEKIESSTQNESIATEQDYY
jgi:hypothetical protein